MTTQPAAETSMFACTVCSDTGWAPHPNGGVSRCKGGDVGSCAWLDAQRGNAPGVPVAEAKSTIENYERTADNGEAIKHAQYFLDGVHSGLYIHGTVGTGKTRLACSLANTLWARSVGVRFKRCPELMVQLQPGHDESDLVWQQMVDAKVLVLDDVGANQGTDFARRMLHTIYDARLDRGHRTIWTSNLDLDELGEFLNDDRLPSRIAGNCRVVELSGKDWRLKRKVKAPASQQHHGRGR